MNKEGVEDGGLSSSVDAPEARETPVRNASDENVEQEKRTSPALRSRDRLNPSAAEAQADLRRFARKHMVFPLSNELISA
jgi:hypothetical protein